MAEFHFIRPFWLLALLPYLVIIGLLVKSKLDQGNWAQICDTELLPYILQEKAVHRSRWPLMTAAIAGLLAIIAIAGPTWERLPSPVFRNVSALVIALDLSRSMDAADIKPSRLRRARFKIADILKQRKDGQTALIVYAGDAFTVTPLTNDTETINNQLSALTTSIMPSPGSDTATALQQAVSLLIQSGLNSGDILLVTDGVKFDQVEDEISKLKAYRLSVLAVGTADGAPIKQAQGDFLKNSAGEIVIPKLDSSTLRKLANTGGGRFQLLTNDSSDINSLQNFFDRRTDYEDKDASDLLLDQWLERGPWLLLLVLPLAALSFRRGVLTVVFLLLMPIPKTSYALEWQDLWQTGDQQGQKLFAEEQYQQASEQFDNPEWKASAQYKAGQHEQVIETLKDVKTSDAFYNTGNAHTQLQQFKNAIDAYDNALELDPNNADAKENRELVKKLLEQQEQQQQSGNDNQESNEQDQSESDQNQQSQDNESESDQQSDESSQEQSQDSEQSPDQQQNNAEPSEQDSSEAQSPEPSESDQPEPSDETAEPMASPESPDESEQANEQWLKRIPDDPAGLLKRKFKYQYGQKKNRTESNENW